MPMVKHRPWAARLATEGLMHAKGVDGSVGEKVLPGGDGGADVGQVESGREIAAVCKHQAHAKLGIALELDKSSRVLVEHLQVEGVLLFGTVESDKKDMVADLGGDARLGR